MKGRETVLCETVWDRGDSAGGGTEAAPTNAEQSQLWRITNNDFSLNRSSGIIHELSISASYSYTASIKSLFVLLPLRFWFISLPAHLSGVSAPPKPVAWETRGLAMPVQH